MDEQSNVVEKRKIVVGLDGSEGSVGALHVAVQEAALWGADLEVLLAWDFLNQPGDDPFDPHFSQEDAEQRARDVVAEALGPTEVAVESRAVCDRAANALIEAGSDADLIVVGARGKGGFLGLRLGSVSQAVLTHSPRPVMVVRAGVAHPGLEGGTVVAGVDGSEHSRRALAWARDEARTRGAKLVVVHGWLLPPAAVGLPSSADVFAESAQALVEGEVEWVATTAPDLEVEGRSVGNGAAGAVLDAAEDAALVVVGGRGRGGFKGLLLGSVSQQVAQHAACPVVVVPAS